MILIEFANFCKGILNSEVKLKFIYEENDSHSNANSSLNFLNNHRFKKLNIINTNNIT